MRSSTSARLSTSLVACAFVATSAGCGGSSSRSAPGAAAASTANASTTAPGATPATSTGTSATSPTRTTTGASTATTTGTSTGTTTGGTTTTPTGGTTTGGTTPGGTASGTTYTVRAGDTLSSIAARFGVTVGALAAANSISDPNLIRVGQVLTIPGATATGSAPASTSTSSPIAAPQVRYMAANSGNYTARSSRSIDRIVIHTIEGSEAGAISWFRNPASNVSAHYVVSHAGRVTRMLRDSDIGWHCRTWNSRSIGIENEGFAHRNTWTTAQYQSLAWLVADLCRKHGIAIDRTHIVGHVEVPGNTHTDPGPYFDWTRFMSMVRSIASGAAPTATASAPASNRGVEVTASTLNVRATANGTVLGQVQSGDRFVLTGQASGDWRELFYAGRTAWAHSGYLRGAGGQGQEVTASALNVRTGASTGHATIGQVLRGQRYPQLGSSGDWREVQFDARSAWSHGGYLQQVTLAP